MPDTAPPCNRTTLSLTADEATRLADLAEQFVNICSRNGLFSSCVPLSSLAHKIQRMGRDAECGDGSSCVLSLTDEETSRLLLFAHSYETLFRSMLSRETASLRTKILATGQDDHR